MPRRLRPSRRCAIIALAISLASPAWAQAPIAVGISAPVTGPFAVIGHQIAGGAKFAIDTINSHGGINGRRVEAIIVDDSGNPAAAANEAEALIARNKVVALVGYPLSPSALAVKRVAQDAKVLMITLATAPELTADNTGSVLRPIGRSDDLAVTVADYVAANFNNSKLGVQSVEASFAFDEELDGQLKAKNIKVSLSDTVPPFTARPPSWVQDAQTVITPLGGLLPDWVSSVAKERPGLHIISPQVVITDDPATALEGLRNVTIISNPWPGLFTSAQTTIARARTARQDTNGYFLYAYAAVEVLAASLARANGRQSATDLFNAARVDEGVNTAMGRLKFSAAGDLVGWQYAVLTSSTGPVEHEASRLFAGPRQYPPASFAAYGIVAFPSRPTSSDRNRYMMICEAYVAVLSHASELPLPDSQQMATVWPVSSDGLATRMNNAPGGKWCGRAVDNYGLVVADQAMKDAAKAKEKLDGSGPFLLAWSPSTQKGKPDALVLVVDLSKVTTPDEAKDRLLYWKERILDNPQIWKPGWDVERIRVLLREWADKFGPQVLSMFGVKG